MKCINFRTRNSKTSKHEIFMGMGWHCCPGQGNKWPELAPILLMKFQLNLKFYMNICLYIFSLISVITMKSCTYQDSFPVLVCAKFHCDQISISWTATMKIFIGFGILSKYRQWDWCLVSRTVLHFSQFGEANTLVTKDTGKIGAVNISTLVYHTCLTTGISVRNVHIYGDFMDPRIYFTDITVLCWYTVICQMIESLKWNTLSSRCFLDPFIDMVWLELGHG